MGRNVALISSVCVAGLAAWWWFADSVEVKKDDRPAFRIDPDKPYRIELGRGSGWHGLDTIRITQDGAVVMHRQTLRHGGGAILVNWETANLRLPPEALAKVLAAVEANRLMELHRSYIDTDVYDGSQWVLWIKQGDREKSVYFSNYFPRPIKRFAQQLDEIVSAHSQNLTWRAVPEEDARKHEQELWDSIKR